LSYRQPGKDRKKTRRDPPEEYKGKKKKKRGRESSPPLCCSISGRACPNTKKGGGKRWPVERAEAMKGKRKGAHPPPLSLLTPHRGEGRRRKAGSAPKDKTGEKRKERSLYLLPRGKKKREQKKRRGLYGEHTGRKKENTALSSSLSSPEEG